MRISRVISKLQEIQNKIGDQQIFYESGDGRSSWMEGFSPEVVYSKNWPFGKNESGYVIRNKDYGEL